MRPIIQHFHRYGYVRTAALRFKRLCMRARYVVLGPERICRRQCQKALGRPLDLKGLPCFTDKLNYLKLHYRNPLVTLCSDKYYVNEYVSACGCGHILKKIFYVGNNMEELDFDSLPDRFFMKCNHLSGNNFVIDKNKNFNPRLLKKYFGELLKENYYYHNCEWGYRNVSPRVICEEILTDKEGRLPVDYKFYCFGGEPKYFMVSYGEYEHRVRNHKFNMEGQSIDGFFKKTASLPEREVKLPGNLGEMTEIVRILCRPFPHVRVDLYNVDGKIYFGELTFYTGAGYVDIYSEEYDRAIGSWIDLNRYQRDMTG